MDMREGYSGRQNARNAARDLNPLFAASAKTESETVRHALTVPNPSHADRKRGSVQKSPFSSANAQPLMMGAAFTLNGTGRAGRAGKCCVFMPSLCDCPPYLARFIFFNSRQTPMKPGKKMRSSIFWIQDFAPSKPQKKVPGKAQMGLRSPRSRANSPVIGTRARNAPRLCSHQSVKQSRRPGPPGIK